MTTLARTTVRLPKPLLREAKKEHINVSEAAREGIERKLRNRRRLQDLEALDQARSKSKGVPGGVDRFIRDLRDDG